MNNTESIIKEINYVNNVVIIYVDYLENKDFN